MRPSKLVILLAGFALVGTWVLSSYGQGEGQEANKVVRTVQGGLLATTPQHQFEVFFYPTGVRVFPQSKSGQPVDTVGMAGTATFYHPNSPNPWFTRPLRVTSSEPASLDLPIGLANAPATGAKVAFEVTGITDPSERKATFTVPVEFVPQSAAQPTAPQAGVAAVPRYTYGPGYYGYGYYPYSSPAAASPPASAYHTYSSPSGHYRGDGDSVGPGHRDWTTGRDNGLAKPWLRPMD
jgi:hypothetical protein